VGTREARVLSWYRVEHGGQWYRVQAGSREAARRYLEHCLRHPRPYEPGYAIWPEPREQP
jgi:hypothetical protein